MFREKQIILWEYLRHRTQPRLGKPFLWEWKMQTLPDRKGLGVILDKRTAWKKLRDLKTHFSISEIQIFMKYKI